MTSPSRSPTAPAWARRYGNSSCPACWRPWMPGSPRPRRGTGPPGLPAGPVRRRDLPPRDCLAGQADAPGPVRRTSHHGRVRLRRQPEAARRADPRPRRPAVAARRRVGHPLLARSGSARAISPRPSATSRSGTAPRPGSSRPAAPSPTWPAGTPTAPGTRRLRELTRPAVLILDDFGMRELTAAQADDLYELITERAGKSLVLTSNRTPAKRTCSREPVAGSAETARVQERWTGLTRPGVSAQAMVAGSLPGSMRSAR